MEFGIIDVKLGMTCNKYLFLVCTSHNVSADKWAYRLNPGTHQVDADELVATKADCRPSAWCVPG